MGGHKRAGMIDNDRRSKIDSSCIHRYQIHLSQEIPNRIMHVDRLLNVDRGESAGTCIRQCYCVFGVTIYLHTQLI